MEEAAQELQRYIDARNDRISFTSNLEPGTLSRYAKHFISFRNQLVLFSFPFCRMLYIISEEFAKRFENDAKERKLTDEEKYLYFLFTAFAFFFFFDYQ